MVPAGVPDVSDLNQKISSTSSSSVGGGTDHVRNVGGSEIELLNDGIDMCAGRVRDPVQGLSPDLPLRRRVQFWNSDLHDVALKLPAFPRTGEDHSRTALDPVASGRNEAAVGRIDFGKVDIKSDARKHSFAFDQMNQVVPVRVLKRKAPRLQPTKL